MSVKNRNSIVTDSLVFCVDAANDDSYSGSSGGTAWTDLVGSSNGTLTNMETNPSSGSYVYNSANGGYIDFDGTDDYANFGNDSSLDYSLSNAVSGEVWVKFAVNNSYQPIISRMHNSDPYNGWEFAAGSNSAYRQSFSFFMRNSQGSGWNNAGQAKTKRTISPVTLPTGTWLQMAFTYDGSGDFNNTKLYKNGALVSSELSTNTTFTGTVSSTANLTIAARQSSSPEDLDIAVVRLYEKELSASEILQNYNALKSRFD